MLLVAPAISTTDAASMEFDDLSWYIVSPIAFYA